MSVSELNGMVSELDAQIQKERRVLLALLDKYSRQKGKLFALRSEMGLTLQETGQSVRIPSFVVTQTLDWIGKEIKMGSEMPFMQSKIDNKGRLKVDESIAESVKQRAPDWTRQPAIAAYLAHDRRRKFGTIVAVINPEWVDKPEHENWGKDGRAVKNSYTFEPLDSQGQVGLLDISNAMIYALDGQHRIMGIRGIQDIRDRGLLELRNKDSTTKKAQAILRDEFMNQFQLSVGDLQSLLNESITVEILPAVLAGETREQASQRVRSVFITINAYSQQTGKSETTLLDESDGFAIVARKAGTLHPLFKGDRVNWKTSTLPQRTLWYTTLQTLKDMARGYLSASAVDLTTPWEPRFRNQVPVRPEEADIEKGKDLFFEFLDRVRAMPVFRGLESGDDLDEVRMFPGYDPKNKKRGKGHLLTRPIGQVILARAVGQLVAKGISLDDVFARLDAWDQGGGFSQHEPASIWYGVTYDFIGDKMNTRTNMDFAVRLLKYMIRGAEDRERQELLEDLVRARDIGKPNETKWRKFDGKEEAYDADRPARGKHLPRPIPTP